MSIRSNQISRVGLNSAFLRPRLETSDGTKRQEEGKFKYVGGLQVTGSYEFIGDDNQTYVVSYKADEKGFQPSMPMLKKNWEITSHNTKKHQQLIDWILCNKYDDADALSDLYQFILNS